MIVCGERDNTIPLAHGRRAHAEMPGSRFETLPKAAHFPNLEDPEGLAEVDDRLPDVDGGTAEREQVADRRAGYEPEQRQPPAGRDGAGMPTEVDLLLGVEVRLDRPCPLANGHPRSTMP
jgi:hypothetical protein